MRKTLRFLSAALLVALFCASASAAVLYTVTDITPAGWYHINNNTQVVGNSTVTNGAALWENGVTTNLGTLPGYDDATAEGISQSGRYICAYAYNWDTTGSMGVLWDNLVMRELAPLEGDTSSSARSVNDSGIAVGTSGVGDEYTVRAVYWADGVAYALPDLGGVYGDALDVTNSGLMVGDSVRADGTWAACLWDDGAIVDLGMLPGYYGAWSRAVNEAGQVVVISTRPEGDTSLYTSALWDDGVFTIMEPVGTHSSTYAYDVNESGQAVGMLCMGDLTDRHAMLWRDGLTSDLNWLIDPDSGWFLEAARSINDGGQIVGRGYLDGVSRRFLLTPVQPVPLPGALLLGCVGLGLAVVCRAAKPWEP